MTSSAGRDTSGFRSPEKKQKNAATFAPDVTFPIAAADEQLGFSCHARIAVISIGTATVSCLCRLAYLGGSRGLSGPRGDHTCCRTTLQLRFIRKLDGRMCPG